MADEDKTRKEELGSEKAPEENPRNPRGPLQSKENEYPYYCTSESHTAMRRKNFSYGGVAGLLIGAAATYLLMQNCNGDSTMVYDQNGTGGTTPVSPQIPYDNSKDKKVLEDPCYESLQAKLNKCHEELGKHKALLESCNKNLESCIEERDELRKRPKSCPTYTPKACPPIKKCPDLPYIRKGD